MAWEISSRPPPRGALGDRCGAPGCQVGLACEFQIEPLEPPRRL